MDVLRRCLERNFRTLYEAVGLFSRASSSCAFVVEGSLQVKLEQTNTFAGTPSTGKRSAPSGEIFSISGLESTVTELGRKWLRRTCNNSRVFGRLWISGYDNLLGASHKELQRHKHFGKRCGLPYHSLPESEEGVLRQIFPLVVRRNFCEPQAH